MRAHFFSSSGPPSAARTRSRICSRYDARSIGGRARPRIANCSGRWPDSARLYIAGSSLRRVRSPDAPKMTRTQGSARGLDMAAELRAERRQDLFGERVILARAEAFEQPRGEPAGGHRLFNR